MQASVQNTESQGVAGKILPNNDLAAAYNDCVPEKLAHCLWGELSRMDQACAFGNSQ